MKLQKPPVILLAAIVAVLLLMMTCGKASVSAAQVSQGVSVVENGEETFYPTLEAAVSAAQPGSVLQLTGDITETVTVAKDITLDLNGCSIDGTVTVANGNVLTVKDTATDDFTVADGYGKIVTEGDAWADYGYIAIREDDGTSYHRLDLQICAANLRPSVAGVYYSSNFGGDEVVKGQIVTYGTALSLYKVPAAADLLADTDEVSYTAFAGDSWICGETGKANGTLLSGILKQSNTAQDNAANAEMNIHSVSYVQLKDGTVVLGAPVAVNLRQLVEKIDTVFSTLSQPQINALREMYATYKAAVEEWTIPNLMADATKPQFYGAQVNAAAGENVTVALSVKNNPGILGMLLSVEYDESVLTLTDTSNGEATAELTYQKPSRLVSGCNFVWYGSKTGDVVDGTVLLLTFQVADSAEAGTYPVKITYSGADTYDANYNPITATVSDGAVTVSGPPPVVSHTVTFVGHDGTVLKTETVEEGKAATAPAAPVRDGYEFIGWDKAFDNVTGDLTVTAVYEQEATGPKLYASKVTASAGDTVTVTVSVKNNPGILGMLLSIEYDESALTLVSTANGDATAALTYLEPSRLVSGSNYLWYGSKTGDVVDGSVLTLTFEVADSVAAGTYPVVVTYSSQDTYDASYNPITATVADGAVTVGGQPSVVTYTVTFVDHDGTVLKTETVEEGSAATAPAAPSRDGYEFIGWDKAFDNVTGDLTVTAVYEQEATGPKLYASKVTASAGDTVTVTVSVKNNPGILGMLLSIEYDESVLTLVSTANGDATAALTYLEPSRLVSGGNYLWYGSKTGDITDGTVLTLTFKVADDASAGTYPVAVTYSSQDTYDAGYNPITAAVADGAVVIG